MGEDKKYLNLGSGQRPFKPPWINWDIQINKWKKFTEDAGCLWSAPWGPGKEYDIICLHHVIEHFGCGEADNLIRQCYDAIRPGGSLLIFLPNIKALAQRWLLHQIDDFTFFVNVYGAYMGDINDRHFWNYSIESLKETLYKNVSWKAFKHFDWRDISGAEIAKDWWIMGVEVVK